ncbi:MAG: PaaI family thioesterase [Terricaulis sp.]
MKSLADHMPFAQLLGVTVLEASPERVVAELVVRDELCTTGGRLHGGAVMAFADTLGGIGGYLTLPEGAKATTTLESKTNFLGGAAVGSTVRGEATPVHIGGRTSVWTTKITSADGKAVALVTQTQMVLGPR